VADEITLEHDIDEVLASAVQPAEADSLEVRAEAPAAAIEPTDEDEEGSEGGTEDDDED
jgi:hypothetical protein